MNRSESRKRPWLAALLGVLATGVGHVYLRRWRRALGWVVALFGVTALFVDPAAIEAVAAGNAVDPVTIAPTLLVASLSALDAYLLAHAHNAVARMVDPERQRTQCPTCGRELDDDLEFCHWCATEVDDRSTSARSERTR